MAKVLTRGAKLTKEASDRAKKAARIAKKAAAKKVAIDQATQRKLRKTDLGLPPGTKEGDPGAGPLRPGQRPLGRATRGDQLTAEERNLRDDYFALTPNARRAERVKGDESKFSAYFDARKRLEREVKAEAAADTSPALPPVQRERTVMRKRPPPRPPRDTEPVTIDGKRYKDPEAIARARSAARVKEKLLARSGGDEASMKVGGIRLTDAQKKAAKKRAAQKKALKAKKRVNIAQGKIRGTTVYAKRGGLMKPIHKDYRKGGLFKKGK
jgi:hypothetical protein|tara:strand:- start:2605 stop:3411 length:807 start_codon:yes stop_codon:yes gene_type:complete